MSGVEAMRARFTGSILGLALVLQGGFSLAGDVVEYYHLDAVGKVLAVMDSNGVIVEQHDYLPYGEEWCGNQVCGSVTPGQPKRFTGKERDAETGLDYFGARYYGSKIGRFTTTDPVYTWRENLVDPQRWNRYAYGRNNPLRFVDPDGRELRTTELARMQEIAGQAGARLQIANGRLDVSGLQPADLGGNEGAQLLVDLATSRNVYSYAEGTTIQTRAGTRPVDGVRNLDALSDVRLSYRPGGAKVSAELPPPGIDASIVINPAARYRTLPGRQAISQAAVTFHELAEAYGRVDQGLEYQPAHNQAAARERTLVQQRPGFTQGLAGAAKVERVP